MPLHAAIVILRAGRVVFQQTSLPQPEVSSKTMVVRRGGRLIPKLTTVGAFVQIISTTATAPGIQDDPARSASEWPAPRSIAILAGHREPGPNCSSTVRKGDGSMSFDDLLDRILSAIGDTFDRVGLAFSRTFNVVVEGSFGDIVLWDVGIIVITSFVVLGLLALFREPLELFHIGQEWLLEKIHNLLEWILNLFTRGMKKIAGLIRKALKR